MQFDEKRYAEQMIGEFKIKRDLAEQLGGDVPYFEKLINDWKAYLELVNV